MYNNKAIARAVAAASLMLATLISTTAHAQLAGHNVILVHGLIIEDLLKAPSKEDVLARRKVSDFWQSRAEGYLNWSAADRLEGGIAEIVFEQAKKYSEQGLCSSGCVLLTHSTGDLVSRYFLAHQEAKTWGQASRFPPNKTRSRRLHRPHQTTASGRFTLQHYS